MVCAQRVVACGSLLGVLISWKLWVTTRQFPHFPVIASVPQPPFPIDIVLFLALLASAAGMVVWPLHRPLLFVFLGTSGALLFLDQMRWQPWFYFYLLMTLPLACGRPAESRILLNVHLQRLVVAGLLFWGGVHKLEFLNSGFANIYEGYLVFPILKHLHGPLREGILLGGRLIPWIEIGIAVGLCFNRTRHCAAVLACLMHAMILAVLIPKEHANVVIWPWNVCMILIELALFFRGSRVEWRRGFVEARRSRWLTGIVTLLVVVMPASYYLGIWDGYLSFHLYSGRVPQFLVFVRAPVAKNLSPALHLQLEDSPGLEGYKQLDVTRWSDQELNVPFVGEERIMQRFIERWCALGFEDRDLSFAIYNRWLPREPARQIFCRQPEIIRPPLIVR